MKNFIEELGWRKMLQDFVPGTEDLLSKEMVIAVNVFPERVLFPTKPNCAGNGLT